MSREVAAVVKANAAEILEQWRDLLEPDSPLAEELSTCFDAIVRIIGRRDCSKFRKAVARVLYAGPHADIEPSEILSGLLLFFDATWPIAMANADAEQHEAILQDLWRTASLVSCTFVAMAREHTDRQMDQHLRELEDISRRVRLRDVTDPLTGLHNHRQFQELLAEEIERAGRYDVPLSLLLVDVDGFTRYNETHGHMAGDQLLQDVARIVTRNCRRIDQPARFASDCFAVILPETAPEDAVKLAERLRTQIESPHIVGASDERYSITASIGIAGLQAGDRAVGRKDLIDAALAALETAKAEGGNRIAGP
ncbi:MAG: GGDEF domain-containing protein [Armatimonadota bacterium]